MDVGYGTVAITGRACVRKRGNRSAVSRAQRWGVIPGEGAGRESIYGCGIISRASRGTFAGNSEPGTPAEEWPADSGDESISGNVTPH